MIRKDFHLKRQKITITVLSKLLQWFFEEFINPNNQLNMVKPVSVPIKKKVENHCSTENREKENFEQKF